MGKFLWVASYVAWLCFVGAICAGIVNESNTITLAGGFAISGFAILLTILPLALWHGTKTGYIK
jgi:hypothetical protein